MVVEIGGDLMIILTILKELCVPTNATLAQLNSLLLACPVSQLASLHQVNISISTIIVHFIFVTFITILSIIIIVSIHRRKELKS